jgi:hypothetical protein
VIAAAVWCVYGASGAEMCGVCGVCGAGRVMSNQMRL